MRAAPPFFWGAALEQRWSSVGAALEKNWSSGGAAVGGPKPPLLHRSSDSFLMFPKEGRRLPMGAGHLP